MDSDERRKNSGTVHIGTGPQVSVPTPLLHLAGPATPGTATLGPGQQTSHRPCQTKPRLGPEGREQLGPHGRGHLTSASFLSRTSRLDWALWSQLSAEDAKWLLPPGKEVGDKKWALGGAEGQ